MKTLALALCGAFMMTPALANGPVSGTEHVHLELSRDVLESSHRTKAEKIQYVERMAKRACEHRGARSAKTLQSEKRCVADLVEQAAMQIPQQTDRFAEARY